MPGLAAVTLVEDEVGNFFGGVVTPNFGPLLDSGLLLADLESIDPVVSSFSAVTMVIVSWISLTKLVKCQYSSIL